MQIATISTETFDHCKWGLGTTALVLAALATAGFSTLFFRVTDFGRSFALYGAISTSSLSFVFGALTAFRTYQKRKLQKKAAEAKAAEAKAAEVPLAEPVGEVIPPKKLEAIQKARTNALTEPILAEVYSFLDISDTMSLGRVSRFTYRVLKDKNQHVY